jgi:Fur family transcriptional regulator, zinc uptake regulator
MHSPNAPHNHQQCIDDALNQARTVCATRQQKLTPIREQVLACVWRSHKPVGAYTILEELAKQSSRRPAPPTVYRALDFLLENDLIHRIASLNAFIGCCDPGNGHRGQFLICRQCQETIELTSAKINQAISDAARKAEFTLESQFVEVSGLCARCQEAG